MKFVTEDREAKKAERNAAKMEKYKEKIKAAELQKEIEEKKKAEEAEQERIRLEAEAAKKKDHKAQLNATKKQRKILRQLAKCKLDDNNFREYFTFFSSRLLGGRR